ncbi:MAG: thrombospondin type 3 repeat-containing protein, partial [Pseudomonadota bacterium]
LPNNGYGSLAAGTRSADTDGDGMPDVWETATGSNPAAGDAMTKAPDGYALIEHYLNWLAGPHASAAGGAPVDVDLAAYAAGFSTVSPKYTVSGAQNGSVALQADGHTARFQPAAGFQGLASFAFQVTGSDATAYGGEVAVLAAP